MGDPQNIPEPDSPTKESADPGIGHEPTPPAEISAEVNSDPSADLPVELPLVNVAHYEPAAERHIAIDAHQEDAASRRHSFRRNLFMLLGLALAAFILASWILVRVDAPFGILSTGPQEIVRAQLRALDRGELRPAYDMFSARYRDQVSFDTWHELFITHWRMFHADVLRAEPPSQSGPGVTLEIYLHGADDKDYRAHFTLIRTDGRWWIDDVHWTQEADERDVFRT
jgi:hypothetical protein